MARENQGLQISLIIFVMLTIVLAVTTYIFFKKYDEADRHSKDVDTAANTLRDEKIQLDSDCKALKKMIGVAETKSMADVSTQFKNDMDSYAGNWPDDSKFYSPILSHLIDAIKARDTKVAESAESIRKLTKNLDDSQKGVEVGLNEFNKGMEERKEYVTKMESENTEQRGVTLEEQKKLLADLNKIRKDAAKVVTDSEQKVEKANTEALAWAQMNKEKTTQLKKFSRTAPDMFCGEVSYLQQGGSVWINVGRADGLDPQTTFSVYSADATNLGKAASKASIEVTRVTGEHMAEARIIKDSISDPIVPGDKLFTPLWSPGEKKHFALVGFLDLDGSGRNNHEAVRNLITMCGGIVDCDADKGEVKAGDGSGRRGEMTINTTYLVRGEQPSDKGEAKDMNLYTEMLRSADRLGVRIISLADLKQQMGYQNQTTVKHFGPPTQNGARSGKAAPRAAKAADADSTPEKSE